MLLKKIFMLLSMFCILSGMAFARQLPQIKVSLEGEMLTGYREAFEQDGVSYRAVNWHVKVPLSNPATTLGDLDLEETATKVLDTVMVYDYSSHLQVLVFDLPNLNPILHYKFDDSLITMTDQSTEYEVEDFTKKIDKVNLLIRKNKLYASSGKLLWKDKNPLSIHKAYFQNNRLVVELTEFVISVPYMQFNRYTGKLSREGNGYSNEFVGSGYSFLVEDDFFVISLGKKIQVINFSGKQIYRQTLDFSPNHTAYVKNYFISYYGFGSVGDYQIKNYKKNLALMDKKLTVVWQSNANYHLGESELHISGNTLVMDFCRSGARTICGPHGISMNSGKPMWEEEADYIYSDEKSILLKPSVHFPIDEARISDDFFNPIFFVFDSTSGDRKKLRVEIPPRENCGFPDESQNFDNAYTADQDFLHIKRKDKCGEFIFTVLWH
jgi:hypothetical protein